jgi:hypothetical protein
MEVKNSKYSQEPNNHRYDDHSVEDRLNIRLHGDEAVHKPQQEPHDDERDNNVDQHTEFSLRWWQGDRDRGTTPISNG